MKRVELRIRSTTSRVPFRPGNYEARLDEVDADGIPTGTAAAYTTRGHETWTSAALAALKKADRMAWDVVNRWLILRKIEAETKAP